HVLLFGQPGLGKTTLSSIIAQAMGARMRITSGPAIAMPGEMASILKTLDEGEFLFIDEIHRLSRPVEEFLYSAMEDFVIDILIGKGPDARSMRLDLPKFTLVGATTRIGLLTAPLRDRFGMVQHLEPYSVADLQTIITRSAQVLAVEITPEGAEEIARRARGTPRIANRLLKRARDFAAFGGEGNTITKDIVDTTLTQLGIDSSGLDGIDRDYLNAMVKHYAGGPVGIENLAAILAEPSDTIEDVIEPYLMQSGFIQRTPRGRVITPAGRTHIGQEEQQND
ncbi:MAG: Holliday junction branch migration DNA helicase RuvB, partial [Alphaproteobacteria bacterium]|nr:Holliday junction branch migration DNA helicase RuvB [Alphaproteobacteria bacterium]